LEVNWPQWLDAGRVWVILTLGSAGLIMLVLAAVFAVDLDLQISAYPLVGFFICLSALVVLFRRWKGEGHNR
jgi:hypothetical protein